MKMNKWTVALAGLGLVSFTSAQAEDAKLVPLQTALSATTISGYVDTSAQWDLGTGNGHVAPFAYNAGKQDGFNLNSADVNISKAIDPSVPWSAGYTVDLLFGPDSQATTSGGNGIEYLRQAFVDLSFPVGNYPDLKVGRFDQLLGFESIDSYKNPNFTRSYGFTMEPTEETGALLHYKIVEGVDLTGGVVDVATTGPINARGTAGLPARAESHKAYTGLLTLTAPKSWGFLADDAVSVGVTHGPGVSSGAQAEDKTHLYVGANLNTPLKDLTFGVGYDAIWNADGFVPSRDNGGNTVLAYSNVGYNTAIAGYLSYKATEKLTFNARVDYAHGPVLGTINGDPEQANLNKALSLTGTVSYDLWANVLTRLEVRWDHGYSQARPFGGTVDNGTPTKKNSILVAANLVYKF